MYLWNREQQFVTNLFELYFTMGHNFVLGGFYFHMHNLKINSLLKLLSNTTKLVFISRDH